MSTATLGQSNRNPPNDCVNNLVCENAEPATIFLPPTGGRLAYQEFGSRFGFPIIYFHDSGSSRLEAKFFDRSADLKGYRIIAIDRPGIGLSKFKSSSSVASFCEEVVQLSKWLGLHKFGLMSLGAGGSFALTMAYSYPSLVQFHLCLGAVPGNVYNAANTSYSSEYMDVLIPFMIKMLVHIRHRLLRDRPSDYIDRLYDLLGNADKKVLADTSIIRMLKMDQQELFRQGCEGVAQDAANCFRKLDFGLEQIQAPVFIWQGSADSLTSRSESEYMASRIPRADLHRLNNRGHFFFIHHMDEIFARLKPYTQIDSTIRLAA
ncbi:MAG: hypothetical protein COC19_08470 [SAR86 cluster bacterium]|uniref:AB hydrolase-1 domain-containing protein n=1 Tax=SAR86 cluster bacterium TaxID=2030880 RepID=A0A2A4MET5_9GAMM|nr:MAG: hypothetical protein COC19_08470 [SAR86 cluster bacterium]